MTTSMKTPTLLPFARLSAAAILVPAFLMLTGCAPVAVKEALDEGGAYLRTNFTPEQLPADARKKIDAGERLPPRFKTIQVNYRIQSDEEGKSAELLSKVNLVNLGNGYVQSRTELARNAIPYRVNLALTYGGFYPLKVQTLFLGRSNAQPAIETKTLARFDRGIGMPQPGATYNIESSTGTSIQIANFLPENQSCVVGTPGRASAVFAELTGDALPVDCTVVGLNNAVVSKKSFAWLSDYGVAIPREITHAQSRGTYSVTGFTVER